MAFLDGIFNRAPAPAPVAPAAQATPVAGPPAGNSATNPQNPAPAAGPAAPNNAAAQAQPSNTALDTLMNLMKPTPEAIAAQKAAAEAANAPILPAVTPEQIQQSLATADFTAAIPQEQMAAALGGDPKALSAVINAAVRAGVAANVQMSSTLVEQGVQAGTSRFNATVDSRFRELQLKNHTTENPALQHPLARTMVDTFARNIALANPRLSPAEVAKQAEQNFLAAIKEMNAPTPAQVAADTPPEKDWLRYLDGGSNAAT